MSTFCGTGGGIRFCGWGCQSEHPFVCFSVKPTQKTCARDLPWNQENAVKRREQGREETSQQKSERWLLRPVDLQMAGWPTREDKSAFLCSFMGVLLEDTLLLAHRSTECLEIVRDFSLLVLGANPSSWLFVLLFFPPLVVYFLCW